MTFHSWGCISMEQGVRLLSTSFKQLIKFDENNHSKIVKNQRKCEDKIYSNDIVVEGSILIAESKVYIQEMNLKFQKKQSANTTTRKHKRRKLPRSVRNKKLKGMYIK